MSLIDQIQSSPGLDPSQIDDIPLYQLSFWTQFKNYFPDASTSAYNQTLESFAAQENFSVTDSSKFSDENLISSWTTHLKDILAASSATASDSARAIQDKLGLEYLQGVSSNLVTSFSHIEAATQIPSTTLRGLSVLNDLYFKERDTIQVDLNDDNIDLKFTSTLVKDDFDTLFTKKQYTLPWDKDAPQPKYTLINYLKAIKNRAHNLYQQGGVVENIDLFKKLQQITNNLDKVISDLDGISDLNDLKTNWQGAPDGRVTTGQNLENAIEASNGVKNDVSTDLKRKMWVFEEFYKTAGTMLTKLNSMYARIANRIHKQ
ncbi:MAG: hypothetical protein ACQEP8_00420 [Chlamydiota bacterium]